VWVAVVVLVLGLELGQEPELELLLSNLSGRLLVVVPELEREEERVEQIA